MTALPGQISKKELADHLSMQALIRAYQVKVPPSFQPKPTHSPQYHSILLALRLHSAGVSNVFLVQLISQYDKLVSWVLMVGCYAFNQSSAIR